MHPVICYGWRLNAAQHLNYCPHFFLIAPTSTIGYATTLLCLVLMRLLLQELSQNLIKLPTSFNLFYSYI
jgi:hypothetical protein